MQLQQGLQPGAPASLRCVRNPTPPSLPSLGTILPHLFRSNKSRTSVELSRPVARQTSTEETRPSPLRPLSSHRISKVNRALMLQPGVDISSPHTPHDSFLDTSLDAAPAVRSRSVSPAKAEFRPPTAKSARLNLPPPTIPSAPARVAPRQVDPPPPEANPLENVATRLPSVATTSVAPRPSLSAPPPTLKRRESALGAGGERGGDVYARRDSSDAKKLFRGAALWTARLSLSGMRDLDASIARAVHLTTLFVVLSVAVAVVENENGYNGGPQELSDALKAVQTALSASLGPHPPPLFSCPKSSSRRDITPSRSGGVSPMRQRWLQEEVWRGYVFT
jgi:hypothetical protein